MRLIALLLSLASLSLIACGGDAASGEDDPASLAPPDAAVYVEAVVRPEGDLRQGVLDAFGKIADTDDPQGEITKLLTKLEQESDEFDYETDVEPWLGERVGVWVSDFTGGDPAFALIAQTTDVDLAMETLRKKSAEDDEKLEERSYEGTDYLVSNSTTAGAIGDFLVIATEAELKRTIKAADGESLAEADRFEEAMEEVSEDRIASFYVDQRKLFEQVLAATPGGDAQTLGAVIDPKQLTPVAGALVADGERVAVESVGSTGGNALVNQLTALSGESTELLGELPADAWVAFGMPDLGTTANELFKTFAGALGGAALEGQFRQQTGLDLQDDVLGWIGDVAVYASGVGEPGVRGALVIEVTDAAKAEPAIVKLTGIATAGGADIRPIEVAGAEAAWEVRDAGLPVRLVLARSEERVVLAAGSEAAVAALGEGDRLSDSDLWARASEALGGDVEPSLILDMGKVLENVTAFGGDSDPDYQEAKRYLDAFDVIAAGGAVDDETQTGHVAGGLK